METNDIHRNGLTEREWIHRSRRSIRGPFIGTSKGSFVNDALKRGEWNDRQPVTINKFRSKHLRFTSTIYDQLYLHYYRSLPFWVCYMIGLSYEVVQNGTERSKHRQRLLSQFLQLWPEFGCLCKRVCQQSWRSMARHWSSLSHGSRAATNRRCHATGIPTRADKWAKKTNVKQSLLNSTKSSDRLHVVSKATKCHTEEFLQFHAPSTPSGPAKSTIRSLGARTTSCSWAAKSGRPTGARLFPKRRPARMQLQRLPQWRYRQFQVNRSIPKTEEEVKRLSVWIFLFYCTMIIQFRSIIFFALKISDLLYHDHSISLDNSF